jgi:hypothetical protein
MIILEENYDYLGLFRQKVNLKIIPTPPHPTPIIARSSRFPAGGPGTDVLHVRCLPARMYDTTSHHTVNMVRGPRGPQKVLMS